MQTGAVFHSPEPPPPQRKALAERASARFAPHLPTADAAASFLSLVTVPVSGRWAFVANGKTGTSSVKRFLFQLEFGVPLTAALNDPATINPDAVSQALTRAGVFRTLFMLPNGLMVLDRAFRLATARHPVTRALSSFLYLCRSHAEASPLLAGERLRINAMCGFDWTRDAGTAQGFLKFLDHVALTDQQGGEGNAHLRPQVRNVQPAVMRPHLVGRTERLEDFCRQIATHFDIGLPGDWQPPQANRNDATAEAAEVLLTPEALRRIAVVFAEDFDWLNEEPHSWAK